ELRRVLAGEVLARHEEAILQATARPTQDGDSDNPSSGLLLAGVPSLTSNSAEAAGMLGEGLVRAPGKEGFRKASHRLPHQKRSVQESDEINTLWNVLALASLDAPSAEAARSRDRARAWLKERKPGVSTESLVAHLLVAQRFKETDRVRGLVEDLLAQQHPD